MEKLDPNDQNERDQRPFSPISVITPKIVIYITCAYAGMILYYFSMHDVDFIETIRKSGIKYFGLFIAIIFMMLFMFEFIKVMRRRNEERFIDVDNKRKSYSRSSDTDVILTELQQLKANQSSIDYDKIVNLVNMTRKEQSQSDTEIYSSFSSYFNSIKYLLEEQARVADQKASILLDKGTSYSKGGITFFIISIISWQILSWSGGFKEQYIYGIVSCSLLFIFIEFLSAWFLKQYRHFVDTSTYLIKVKSIFDRYMLSYLTVQHLSSSSDDNKAKYQKMLTLLSEDIKWPESYLLKNGDISFAKEAMETMTHFAKAIRSEAKTKHESGKDN